jgi:hypothetical protein
MCKRNHGLVAMDVDKLVVVGLIPHNRDHFQGLHFCLDQSMEKIAKKNLCCKCCNYANFKSGLWEFLQYVLLLQIMQRKGDIIYPLEFRTNRSYD